MALTIPVILGSVRADRIGIRAARFLIAQLAARGHAAPLVDPAELALPLLDRMFKEYPAGTAPEPLQRCADLFRRADAFLVVTAEYNHGVPPALSNTLDHFLEEYFWRPSAICCYSAGQFGGVRAAMPLRAMLAEMGMSSIPSLLPIPRLQKVVDAQGVPAEPWLAAAAGRFLDELEWHAEALRDRRRRGTPY
ncbi:MULTISPECIES: NADPH-dependent FMN reductase [Methylobacterium]|jgi:NAD(P)H-dependent FMN reductase|uniref:NADPH-dependent FMN reductase n=1 Tax=Methylobacterium radiotolerans (strain ATCC 27329 / DSM 1819 / JCM 2831 / NBRC 15690 / NCIMB 10815 / 0-1) TaxID=426355 RepID=B1LZW7_METRJ|nr:MULTISPECIES: NAD(P)H-dependent oxidoreductase [Methylobacterium]MBY0396995.1 NAD(P)H-dependent oxidoreductase [Thermoleophilia bacterium]GAN50316.1 NADPH-dependent FMN reductase [Methylobacterium sp. ME121]ACB24450.1 NADPH-dependent FMN reductase [Methylobacterium radiotolerans JCM 2831]KIU33699.1 NADPH-dependent FMN reductase [Methylobacterium radiotolerans]KTS12189.1 NADPH-dependent FMN reductase [Methylobacterium radiotolerans]